MARGQRPFIIVIKKTDVFLHDGVPKVGTGEPLANFLCANFTKKKLGLSRLLPLVGTKSKVLQKKNENWTSGCRNSSPERAIYPQGGRKKSRMEFCDFSVCGDLGVVAGY